MANGKRTLTGSISSGQTLTGSVKGGSGTTDHSRLVNRAEPDQHPIEAITGLRPELDSKINSTTALSLIEEATNAAASDATSKANAAETAAKSHADTKAAAAELRAKAYADSQDDALKTALEGGDTDITYAKTIKGAKDFAEAKASTAESTAKSHADSIVGIEKANREAADIALHNVISKEIDDDVNAAIAAIVGTANDDADADTIKGVRKTIAASSAATLASAQTYADTAAANAVKNDITIGNTDIVITRPTSGENKDKTVISHKDYSAGTFTKTPESLAKDNDTYFFKSITVSNGHVTGGEMQSLAEALSAMTFIFDGGTSAN